MDGFKGRVRPCQPRYSIWIVVLSGASAPSIYATPSGNGRTRGRRTAIAEIICGYWGSSTRYACRLTSLGMTTEIAPLAEFDAPAHSLTLNLLCRPTSDAPLSSEPGQTAWPRPSFWRRRLVSRSSKRAAARRRRSYTAADPSWIPARLRIGGSSHGAGVAVFLDATT